MDSCFKIRYKENTYANAMLCYANAQCICNSFSSCDNIKEPVAKHKGASLLKWFYLELTQRIDIPDVGRNYIL